MAFLREALSEQLLRFGVDVVSVPEPFALAPEDLERLLVPDAFEGEFRADRRRPEEFQVGLPGCAHSLDRMVHRPFEESENVLLPLDPGDLAVERLELGHVADRVGRLGAECRRDLENAVEARRHQHLLVELRALTEVRLPAEVVCLEERGASLRPGPREFRRLHFDEGLPLEVVPEGRRHDRADRKDRAPLRLPEIEGAVVEPGVHIRADLVRDREGQRRGGGAEHIHRLRDQLPSVPDLAVRLDGPARRDDAFPDDLGGPREQLRVRLLDRHLEGPGPLAHDQEGDAAEVPDVLRPAREGHVLPMVGGADGREGAEKVGHGIAEKEDV